MLSDKRLHDAAALPCRLDQEESSTIGGADEEAKGSTVWL